MTLLRSTSIIWPNSPIMTFRKVSRFTDFGRLDASRPMIDSRASWSFSLRSSERLCCEFGAGCMGTKLTGDHNERLGNLQKLLIPLRSLAKASLCPLRLNVVRSLIAEVRRPAQRNPEILISLLPI